VSDMKKRSKWTIIISLLLVVTSAFIVLLQFEKKYSLRHYFEDWKSESDDQFASVLYGTSLQYPGTHQYEKIFQDVKLDFWAEMIYSIENGRVYFFGSEDDTDQKLSSWKIASMKTDKTDVKIHYEVKVPSVFKYYDLSNTDLDYIQFGAHPEKYGGLYDDHKIYLKTDSGICVYDIINDSIAPIDALPQSEYAIDTFRTSCVVITKDNEPSRTITLESMAKTNAYVNQLLEFNNNRTLNGKTFLEDIFSYARVLNGEIYLVCRVYNLYEAPYVIVFRYEYDTDSVYYVTSAESGEHVEVFYAFIPIYEE